MIFWSVLAVYVLGWVLSVRPALRRRMLAEIQVPCDRPDCPNLDSDLIHPNHCDPVFRPRGAVRDRRNADAWAAVGWAGIWPLTLLAVGLASVLYVVFAAADRGVGAFVLQAPLTGPELERRLREQEAEIDRLSKQITEEKP